MNLVFHLLTFLALILFGSDEKPAPKKAAPAPKRKAESSDSDSDSDSDDDAMVVAKPAAKAAAKKAESSDDESSSEDEKPAVKKAKTAAAPAAAASSGGIKTVFVASLAWATTEDDIRGLFGEYGTITYEITLKLHPFFVTLVRVIERLLAVRKPR
jgi:hypothetical protein